MRSAAARTSSRVMAGADPVCGAMAGLFILCS
jgi:hypothetical protein